MKRRKKHGKTGAKAAEPDNGWGALFHRRNVGKSALKGPEEGRGGNRPLRARGYLFRDGLRILAVEASKGERSASGGRRLTSVQIRPRVGTIAAGIAGAI